MLIPEQQEQVPQNNYLIQSQATPVPMAQVPQPIQAQVAAAVAQVPVATQVVAAPQKVAQATAPAKSALVAAPAEDPISVVQAQAEAAIEGKETADPPAATAAPKTAKTKPIDNLEKEEQPADNDDDEKIADNHRK